MKHLFSAILLALALCQPAAAAGPAPDFQETYRKVIRPHEGLYANNPQDAGGETYQGIARKKIPLWSGWKLIDQAKGQLPPMPKYGVPNYRAWVKELNARLNASQAVQGAVSGFYFRNIWQQYHLGEFRLKTTAERAADALTNNGPISAIWLKKAINRAAHRRLVNDKTVTITSETVKTLNAQRQDLVLFWFAVYRGARYDQLADHNEEFVDTWAEREIDEIITAVHDRDALLKASQGVKR